MSAAPPAAGMRLPSAPTVVAVAAVAALGATAAPLLAYALSLAVLGAPHVLAELRYVDGRFGRRLGRRRGLAILAVLAGIVVVRIRMLGGHLAYGDGLRLELGAVAVLAIAVLPSLAAQPVRLGVAVLGAAVLVLGATVHPAATLVVLAVLHNTTPVGFLAERLRGPARRRALAACAFLFVVVPIGIATGLPARALASAGLLARDATWGTTGGLSEHLSVYVLPGLRSSASAADLFAAAAYLQILHHLTVLFVLPRLLGARADDRPVAPWPRAPVLVAALLAVSVGGAMLFARDFLGSRAAYGLLASVHAWIEVPVLLLALAGGRAAVESASPLVASAA